MAKLPGMEVLGLLADGPASCPELAAELGYTVHHMNQCLWWLKQMGFVETRKLKVYSGRERTRGPKPYLYYKRVLA